jgi:two-component system chemotaxis sensor kinase CheA
MTGPDLRALYRDEAEGQLDRLADGALALERGEGSADLVGQLFRDAHNLKSSSGLVGLPVVGEVAHGLEDILGDLRAGRREADAQVVGAILGVTDALRVMIPQALAGKDVDPLVVAAQAALDAARPGASADPPAAPVAPASPSPEAPAPDAAAPDAPARDVPVEDTAPADTAPPASAPGAQESDPAVEATVAVARDRLDRLVRLAGEAIAQNLRLGHLLEAAIDADPEAEAAALVLARTLDGLRTQAVAARTTTLGAIAAPLRRAIRDVARARGKEIDYAFEGDRVELDRAVLDGLREPLLHLVRNAADHGIETPAVRRESGKPTSGSIRVAARRRGPEIVIEVSDDGGGLDLHALRERAGQPELDDRRAADLVFRAGLSTAASVTDVSGRGVGLDAVRTGVESLRGRVSVESRTGTGTTFTIVVPLTLAVLPCVLVEAAGERYAIPAHAAVSLVENPQEARVALDGGSALWVGGDVVAFATLGTLLGAPRPSSDAGPAIVLDAGAGRRCALRLDEVHGQRAVTVTEIGSVVPRSELVTGASIEPDGSIVLVLDPVVLVERTAVAAEVPRGVAPDRSPSQTAGAREAAGTAGEAPSVLVVDDAMTVRELQRSILDRAGFDVRVATGGRDALAQLAERRPDLVVTDVEMPGLDGLGLTRAIRATPALASLPVLMVTSRASDEDRAAGLEAGADAYLVKQDFDETALVAAVTRLLGGTP